MTDELVTEDQRARLEGAVREAMDDMLASLEAGGMTRAQAVRAVVDAILRGPPDATKRMRDNSWVRYLVEELADE